MPDNEITQGNITIEGCSIMADNITVPFLFDYYRFIPSNSAAHAALFSSCRAVEMHTHLHPDDRVKIEKVLKDDDYR